MSKMEEYIQFWTLFQIFEKKWNEKLAKKPFHLCLLDFCKTYENFHTNILLEIFRYRINGKFLLITLFFDMIGVKICWNHDRTIIEFNREYIDGYLCDGKNAVIIENKINGAVDQWRQIERYVDVVVKRGILIQNIYVLYLTRDGSKRVSEDSLTLDLRKKIGNRFIEINYRSHILPWIKEVVFPLCNAKDEIFIAALKQYVDFLEGVFQQRLEEKKMNGEINTFLKENLGVVDGSWFGYKEVENKIQTLETMKNCLANILHEVKESVVDITKEYWNDIYKDSAKIEDGILSYGQFLYWGRKEYNCNECFIHLEWYPLTEEKLFNDVNLIMNLHFEGKFVQKYKDCLNNKKNGFERHVKDVGMIFNENGEMNCQKKVIFEKPLAQMTVDERRAVLRKEYDFVAPLLEYVYGVCEKIDGVN